MLAIYFELPQRAARGQQLQPGPHPRRGPARRDLVGHLADRGQVAADHPVDPLQFPYERLAAGVGLARFVPPGLGHARRSRVAGSLRYMRMYEPYPACSASRRNPACRNRRFSVTSNWDVMWVAPASGSTVCGRPAPSSAADNRNVLATTTLSSARPWTSISGRRRFGASLIRLDR